MSSKATITFLVSASLFIQCLSLQEIISPSSSSQPDDLQTILQDIRTIIRSGYLEGYQHFQNISQAATSALPETRDKAHTKIAEISKKHREQFEKIKTQGLEAGIDVNVCLEFFEYGEDTVISDLSVLDGCFSEKIDSFINTLYGYQRSYNEDLLSALYKIEHEVMSCTSSKCVNDLISTLGDIRIILPGVTKSKLSRNERELIGYFKDIEACGDKTAALSEATKIGLVGGFQICVDNEIKFNRTKKEEEDYVYDDDEDDDDY